MFLRVRVSSRRPLVPRAPGRPAPAHSHNASPPDPSKQTSAMHSTTPAAKAACVFVLALASIASSPQAQKVDTASASAKVQAAAAAKPGGLISVPGGKVTLGTPYKQLLEYASQHFRHRNASVKRINLLRKLMSESGEREATIKPFYLARTLVTNEQYMLFVQNSKPKHRFPIHWWRYGEKDHYNSMLEEAREAFKQKNPTIPYWEAYWEKLPYSIPEGTEQHAVNMVSWRDAIAFAAWCGMRLPTEDEWQYAATGGKPATRYLWGNEDLNKDQLLKKLMLGNSRDRNLKPVGTVGEIARGPFGHEDMVGNLWEWMAGRGFDPYVGKKAFERELRKLRRANKEVANIQEPLWKAEHKILRGGSYLSWSSVEELRLGTRCHMRPQETVEGAGFRLAKSPEPGRDMCESRLLVEYDNSIFGGTREPALSRQLGVERYDLAKGGTLITGYHSVSFVPVNHLGVARAVTKPRLQENSREKPLGIGTLVTTEALETPKLEPGVYTVYYRPKGMPKKLLEALSEGSRALIAERKKAEQEAARASKAGKKGKGGKKGKSGRKGEGRKAEAPKKESSKKKQRLDWRAVLRQYGITDEEAAVKKAQTKIDFVRLMPGNFKVSTTQNLLLFRSNSADGPGAFVAALPTLDGLVYKTGFKGPELNGDTFKDKERLTFTLGPATNEKSSKRMLFKLPLVLTTPPNAAKPWTWPAK